MSALLRRAAGFFKLSDLPREARLLAEAEGLLFSAERLRITVFYRRFKAPGRYFVNKSKTGFGSLAISRKRFSGYAFRKRIMNIPFDIAESKGVKFSCINGKVLVAAFDASAFNIDHSGQMEIRYHFDGALEAYGIIRDLQAPG